MKISENIAQLQALLAEHGDLEVFSNDCEWGPERASVGLGVVLEDSNNSLTYYPHSHVAALLKEPLDEAKPLDEADLRVSHKLMSDWQVENDLQTQSFEEYLADIRAGENEARELRAALLAAPLAVVY